MTKALLLTVDHKTGAASVRTLDEPSFMWPHIFEVNRWRIKAHRDGTGHKAFKFALNLQEAG